MRRVPLPAASLLAALALAGSLAVVAGSLLLRILHRGPYYPGFDLAGSANGLFIVSTRTSFWEAVAYLWQQNRR